MVLATKESQSKDLCKGFAKLLQSLCKNSTNPIKTTNPLQ
jgi:hypothetical protein